MPLLIDAPTLAARLHDPALRIFDTTVFLDRPPAGGPYTAVSRRDRYEEAHIPGAAFADVPGDLSDPDSPFPFTVPSAERFAAAAGQLGIGPGTSVVVYTQDAPGWATRLWWLLRFFGFDDVSVLDGGLTAWRAAGGAIASGPETYAPGTFTAVPRRELLAPRADVEQIAAGQADACLVNALAPRVFRGEGVTNYSRPGRIPRSVSAPWMELVDPDTQRFLEPDALRERFAGAGALGERPVVAYCGGGISATVDLFALALLGRTDARLYDGSLTEWTADPALPVETG
ncbi:MAG: sulfurtransferase [Solirubrobacteraceae bacterium]|nr:sulfurtransferase [Solirubrobacteraceae bacterium]